MHFTRRPWFLLAILLLLALAAFCVWLTWRDNRRSAALAEIKAAGGSVEWEARLPRPFAKLLGRAWGKCSNALQRVRWAEICLAEVQGHESGEEKSLQQATAQVEAWSRQLAGTPLRLTMMSTELRYFGEAPLPDVQVLHIWPGVLSADDAPRLGAFPNLEVLFLRGGYITSQTLAAIPCRANLRELGLVGVGLDDEFLSQLARLPKLSQLYLSGIYMTRMGPTHCVLQEPLELLDVHFTDLDCEDLRCLWRFARPRQFSMRSVSMAAEDCAAFATFDRVEDLGLYRCTFAEAGLAHLSALARLRKLHLNETGITDAALPLLAAIPNLELVAMRGTAVTAAGVARLQTQRPGLKVEW